MRARIGGQHTASVVIMAMLLMVSTLLGCGEDGSSTVRPIPQPTVPIDPRTHEIPSWFTDAKFGIFIHWGIYSVPAWAPVGTSIVPLYAEWYWFYQQIPFLPWYSYHLDTYGRSVTYDDFIPQFRAENWDPAAWIQLIKDAGARYWVLTTKHHEGFALWPTETSDRNSMKLGPHRDLVGDLIESNRGSGLKVGLYYSLPEWFTPAPKQAMYQGASRVAFETYHHPQDPYREGNPELPYTGYKPIDDYATGQVIPQIEELIDRYHPSILWCDIGGDPQYYQTERWLTRFLTDGAKQHPEGVTANDRCGQFGDFDTPEYTAIPEPGGRYFEATRGLGHSFGYNQNEKISDYLTDAEAIYTLIDTVAGGGNLLLDIGPKADGTVPEVMRDRLLAIGRWLEINGQAIYATAPWTHRGNGTIRYTVGKDGSLYVIDEEWPGEELVLDAPIRLSPDSKITLLGSNGAPLTYALDGQQLVITLPQGEDAATATRSTDAFVFRITGVHD
jgi:alpha-L-fucosidase